MRAPRTSHGPQCLGPPRRDLRPRRHAGRHQRRSHGGLARCLPGLRLSRAERPNSSGDRQGRRQAGAGTEDLLGELRRCSIATAVATSSTRAHLNATLASSGLDLDRLVGHIVTGGPSLDSKSAPDLIDAGTGYLTLGPFQTKRLRQSGSIPARKTCGLPPEN